jgi:hypothetical protein
MTTGASSANRAQFNGRENDQTGLYYYRARFYSPSLQRFISEDPIGLRPAARTRASGPRARARHRQRRHHAEMRRAPRPGAPTPLAVGYRLASIDSGPSSVFRESGLRRLDGQPPEIIARYLEANPC